MDEHETLTQQTDDHASHDCSGCCSPFAPCNTAPGFTVENAACTQMIPQNLSAEINTYRIQLYTSPFLGSIWQPPKRA
ncbi:MAG: hypothetical protein LBB90_04795 [Tannerella sp.]|jgi:hypothetical protein|nr:hypothetical protein [Tannerella sp.]